MKKLLSIVGVLAGLTSSSFANQTVVMPFTGTISYDSVSQKDHGNFYGLYLKNYNNFSKSSVELNYENDKIKYKKETTDYRQSSLSFVVNNFVAGKFKTRLGMNYINIHNQNSQTFNNYIGIVGNEIFTPKYSYGFNIYYAKIKSSIDHSWQISPYINSYLFNIKNLGAVWTKIQYNYIRLSDKNAIDNKDLYSNYDVSLSNYNPSGYTTTFKMSLGKNSYKVDNGGFVFYNTGNVIKHSYLLSENVQIGYKKDKFVKISVKKSNVEDIDTNGKIKNGLKDYTFTVMAGFVF